MYTLQKVVHPTQIPSYSEKIAPLLDSGLSVYPDHDGGIWLIKNEDGRDIFFLTTRNFNKIMHKISHYVQDSKSKQIKLKDLITYLKQNLPLYADQANLSYKEFEEKIKKEYLFISTHDKNVFIPLFDEDDKNYVKGGILHFLLYHYSSFKKLFAKKKLKTLFKEPITINELFGFLIIILDSDETESTSKGNREILESNIDSEKYRLILEPFEQLEKLVSFYRCGNSK